MLALAGSLFGSCDKEVIKPEPDTGIISLSSDSEDVTFTNQNRVADISSYPTGGMYEITITTSYDWELDGIEEISDWCHVEKTGTGLLIDIDKYEEDGTRDGMISLVAEESDIAYVRISQTGLGKEPCIYFEKSNLEYFDNGGSRNILVVTNMNDWAISGIEYLDDNDGNWVKATKDESGKFFTVEINRNENDFIRKANIIIEGKSDTQNISDTLHISQWEATMLIEVELTEEDNNLTVTLPFKGDVDLTVVWNDSIPEYFKYARTISGAADYISYTYPKAGKYNIRIKGNATAMSTECVENDQWPTYIEEKYIKPIKSIKQWGNLKLQNIRSALAYTGVETVAKPANGIFNKITSAKWLFKESDITEIPDGFFDEMESVTDISGAFLNCINLNSINDNLLSKCTKLTDASYIFSGCNKISEIPENLFESNIKLENISYAFSGTSITEIPSDILKNSPEITDIAGLLSGCRLLEAIPENLLSNTPKLQNLSYLFSQCSQVKEIPEQLLYGLNEITDISYMFAECSSIKSIPSNLFYNPEKILTAEKTFFKCSELTEIPESIFDNFKSNKSFRSTFLGCNKITRIPSGLFSKCQSAELFLSTFCDCSNITEIPEKLFPLSSKEMSNCFQNCILIEDVPEGLFEGLINVTHLDRVFQGCTNLKNIPQGLFEDCENCGTYAYTFFECSSLTSIPERLLNGTKAINYWNAMDNTFAYCTSLREIPSDLFTTCVKTQGITNTFRGCTSLENIPEGLFDNCTEITEFSGLFSGCTNLKYVPVDIFDNCTKVTNFDDTFNDCSSLNGESPYTVINGNKIHLYERNTENGFKKPYGYSKTFRNASFSDYDNIPKEWK